MTCQDGPTGKAGGRAAVLGALVCQGVWLAVLALALTCPGGASASVAERSAAEARPVVYTVRQGETLREIARRFGISVDDLTDANDLRGLDRVAAGYRLRIPRPGQDPREGRGRSAASERISISFSNADVREVLARVAQYTKTDIILMPSATGSVTVNLRARTAAEAIQMIAASAGLAATRIGSAYFVGTPADVQKVAGQMGQSEIVPLHYLKPADAVDLLGRLAPTVKVEAATSAAVLSGLPEDVAAASAALRRLDVKPAPPAPEQVEASVVTLKYAQPDDTARILSEAYPALKVDVQDGALILHGGKADLQAASAAIQTLDTEPAPTPEPQEMDVYRLKYLNANTAEVALKKALPDLHVAAGPEAMAPPAAMFNPLVGGFQSSISGGGGTGGGGVGGGSGSSSSMGGGGIGGATNQQFSRATRLILIGARSDVEMAKKLLDETDVPQPIVRIEAAIIEANQTDLANIGLQWDFTDPNTGGPSSFTFTIPGGKNMHIGSITRSDLSFNVALQALVSKNKARILASPNISVVDNEDASIFIGELRRFFGTTVVTPTAGTVQGTDTVPVGIALLVRPHIHPNNDVTLKVHPVVSTVNSIVDGLPQTSSREADTTVRLHEGEELIIGGLDQDEVTRSEQKVPLLGDLPLIGHLFRVRNDNRTRTEIVIIIRAYPVTTDVAPPHDFGNRAKQ